MTNIEGVIFDWIETLAINSEDGLFHYSEDVVKKLSSKYKLSLISIAGFGVEKRKQEIEKSGLTKYFEHIIVDTIKTEEQYRDCMKCMKTTPEKTLVVDDRTLRGIKIGNKLGCQTYWIKNGKYAHELPNEETGQPTRIINSVEDLLYLL